VIGVNTAHETVPGPDPGEWIDYLAHDFSFDDFPAGSRVLDVGFGGGFQIRGLAARGCAAFGVEADPGLALRGRTAGAAVCRAFAEALPFRDAVFDGLICKVVVPYTDEARAVREIARVLRTGGIARVSYHGLGYNLRYLLTDANWKRRVYGARVIANTAVYALTGHRVPGFWGDTVYQSERRLRAYYRAAGLRLLEHQAPRTFLGAPVFIYHILQRLGGTDMGTAARAH
jgi:SAM-dependent methyltransferase